MGEGSYEAQGIHRDFELCASQFVLDEAAAGDEDAAASRLAALAETALLGVTEDAILLAERLIAGGGRCCPVRHESSRA